MPIENLIVVGHSLGGALAKIMGAVTATRLKKSQAPSNKPTQQMLKLRVHGVGFSGPGTVFASRYYGYTPNDLTNAVVNIVPVRCGIPCAACNCGASFLSLVCRGATSFRRWTARAESCKIFAVNPTGTPRPVNSGRAPLSSAMISARARCSRFSAPAATPATLEGAT